MIKRSCAVLACIAGFVGVLLLTLSVAQAGGELNNARSTTPRQIPTDRLIVKLRDTQMARATHLDPARVAGLSANADITLAHVRAMSGGAQVLKLPRPLPLAEVTAIARQLSTDPQVEYAEPDRIMRPLLFPNDAQYGNQWHYHSNVAQPPYAAVAGGANLPGAWDVTTGSVGIVVAVIDTGLVPHADIDSNILDGPGRVVPGHDFVSEDGPGLFWVTNDGNGRDTDPTDPGDWVTAAEDASGFFAGCGVSNSSWHGTHVAGTLGAIGNNGTGVTGINWVSRILPVRVLGKCAGYLSDVIDGTRWAAGLAVAGAPTNANPAQVLNLSLGGDGNCSTAEQTAINDVVAAGVVMVVAAGNSNVDLGVTPQSPANCNNVISVAAVNRHGGRAFYSNYGTTVKIAAPGGDQRVTSADGILSTLNTGTTSPVTSPGGDAYRYYQGTSMATPHVAGIVSLMLSVNPTLTPVQVLSVLQGTARAFPAGTGSDCTGATCGAGIVNAAAAVAAAATSMIVTVSATDATAAEAGLNPGTFTITRTGVTASPLTVTYSMSGSAASGTDYATPSGSVVIAANAVTATVTVTPVDDPVFEGNETVVLTLSANPAYGVGVPGSATVTVADNDLAPPPSLSRGSGCTLNPKAGFDPMLLLLALLALATLLRRRDSRVLNENPRRAFLAFSNHKIRKK